MKTTSDEFEKNLLEQLPEVLKRALNISSIENEGKKNIFFQMVVTKGFIIEAKNHYGEFQANLNLVLIGGLILDAFAKSIIRTNEDDGRELSEDEIIEQAKTVTVSALIWFRQHFESEILSFIENYISNSVNQTPISATDMSPKEHTKVLNLAAKFNDSRRKAKQGIRRGGARPREGFKWTDENKVLFYETVEDLQKKNGKPIWNYAFDELLEKDFDSAIKTYLKTKTPLKDVPELFNKAVKIWQGYKDSLSSIEEKEKPKAFAFRHALVLLNFPKTKYSTMKKYFGDGKRIKHENSK